MEDHQSPVAGQACTSQTLEQGQARWRQAAVAARFTLDREHDASADEGRQTHGADLGFCILPPDATWQKMLAQHSNGVPSTVDCAFHVLNARFERTCVPIARTLGGRHELANDPHDLRRWPQS